MPRKANSLIASLTLLASFVFFSVNSYASNGTLVTAVKKLVGEGDQTLTILYPKGSLPNIQVVVDSFKNQTGVDIKLLETSVDDINTRMLLGAVSQSSQFDVALPATFGIPDLVEAGALADLSQYAATYEPQVSYEPSLYDLGDRYKGKFYGYQTDGDTYVMFYQSAWLQNEQEKKRFKERFGRELKKPTSWQELDQVMEHFHRPDEDMCGGALFRTPRYMVWEWWIRFHALGTLPFNDDMKAIVNSAEGIQALDQMISATEYLHPSVSTNGLVDNWKLYAQGKCFANIGWGGSQKHFNSENSKVRDALSYAPTPSVSYFNWGWNYVVSKFSANTELAYLFTLFATMPDISTMAVQQEGFFDPFRSQHYEDASIQKVYSTEFLQAHKTTMKNAIPDLYIEGRGKYIEVLEEAFVSALEGQISAKEALDYVARRWDALTTEIGQEKQLEQWLFLKSKYPTQAQ